MKEKIKGWEFDLVRALVREGSGMVIGDDKAYIVESKLINFCRGSDYANIGELVAALRRGEGDLRARLVEHMTNNETLFFRDAAAFDALEAELIPRLVAARSARRELRIWSAAASSGQEIYSVAIALREACPELRGWKLELLATDISRDMIARCREATYSRLELGRGMPEARLKRYFEPVGDRYRVIREIRDMVEFRELNLTRPWPSLPAMDLVLLRNVLIYFDLPTKREILGRVRKVLAPDGYLVLGGGESTMNLDEAYERVRLGRSVFYQLGARVARSA